MNENRDDVQRMQKEAIRRVQEMQSRAKNSLDGKHNHPNHQNAHQPQHPHSQPPHEKKSAEEKMPAEPCKQAPQSIPQQNLHKAKSPMTISPPFPNLLDAIMKDGERNLLLILILILVGEGADSSIILALMYLML